MVESNGEAPVIDKIKVRVIVALCGCATSCTRYRQTIRSTRCAHPSSLKQDEIDRIFGQYRFLEKIQRWQ